MLLIGDGVVVGVFHIGDKEVIGGIIGVQGGIKGIDTGIGNGADGQAAAVVGIVGIQYRLRHIVIVVGLHIVPDEIIGGAALQHGVFAGIGKAVVEYRGNIVHLLHAGAFLLHDGGEDDPFLQGKAAVLQSRFVFLSQHLFFKLPQLGGDDIPCGGIGVEGVGLRIQEALQHCQLAPIGAYLAQPVEVIIGGVCRRQIFLLGA